jgi:hypothetical protein
MNININSLSNVRNGKYSIFPTTAMLCRLPEFISYLNMHLNLIFIYNNVNIRRYIIVYTV